MNCEQAVRRGKERFLWSIIRILGADSCNGNNASLTYQDSNPGLTLAGTQAL
jgi:hypothetical protein